jgi:type VI secretion system secreted protein VgrG
MQQSNIIPLPKTSTTVEVLSNGSILISNGLGSLEIHEDGTIKIKGTAISIEGSSQVKINGARVDLC